MAVYLTFLSECEDYLSSINSLKPSDTLLLLYPEDEDKVSIKVAEKIINSKYKVEYILLDKSGSKSLDIVLSFTLGKLMSEYKNIKCLTNNELVKSLLPSADIPSKKAPSKKVAASSVKKEPEAPKKEEKPKVAVKDNATEVEKPKITRVRKKNYPLLEGKDITPLVEILATCKDDNFDPSRYADRVAMAVYNAQTKKIAFNIALNAEMPSKELTKELLTRISSNGNKITNIAYNIFRD